MRIQYCSDLHLEFARNREFVKMKPLDICGDILLLAGDIIPLGDGFYKEPFFSFVSDNFEKVFWVPGNHEYYNRNLSEYDPSFNFQVRENVHLLNNTEFSYGDVHFAFCTLWSRISEVNESIIEQNVADFDLIERNYKKIRSSDYNDLHSESLKFLHNALISEKKKNSVVVTHHLPSRLCDSVIHNSSPINEAFCSDLNDLINESEAKFWIHGHSHYNHRPLIIGKTIVLTNQLGYLHANEQSGFKQNAFFSI